jgi:hypothetical protein
MGRNYLWYRRGDTANAVLATVGYNSRPINDSGYAVPDAQRSHDNGSDRFSLKATFFADDQSTRA